jgi:oligopeptidase A
MNSSLLLTNPLLSTDGPPDFEQFRASHVEPAIVDLLARCESAVEQAVSAEVSADYASLSRILDVPLQALDGAWGLVMHLSAVCNTPELRAAVAATQPKVTAFYSRLHSNAELYRHYMTIAHVEKESLSEPQRKSLTNALRNFRLAGVELRGEAKARFAGTQLRSAALTRDFANHVQDATDAFVHWATASELEGLPASLLATLEPSIENLGQLVRYKMTLNQSCLAPVLQFADRRELREMLYQANVTRASEFGPAELDNGPLLTETVALRHERATLLGMNHHAAVSLSPKMAQSAEDVLAFLRDLGRRARQPAQAELDELRDFAREHVGLLTLEAWDMGYVSEKLRQARYAFSEEEVRSHFRLDRVLAGLFEVAGTLFNVVIRPDTVQGWHPDTSAYRVERDGALLARFLVDPFSRPGKRAGAWFSGARPRWRRPDGSIRTALGYLVTNFAKPAEGQPALLRHGDVVTLFHEFGHCLHFALSTVDVLGVSGFSGVEWDAIELPSQLMENYAWDWSVVERMSCHAATGAKLPRELFDRMLSARRFQSALGLLRQVEMALFDMRLHAETGREEEAQIVLDEVRAEVALVSYPPYNRFQNTFSHVFAGGYAAGYYSYLWADVLACDAWQAFMDAGVLCTTTGRRYLVELLERGGSRTAAQNFEAFRGRKPMIDALLEQRGLGTQQIAG